MTDGWFETSFYDTSNGIIINISATDIRNGLVEVSQNGKNFTLVVFDHELSILNGTSATTTNLTNGDAISHLNETSLL